MTLLRRRAPHLRPLDAAALLKALLGAADGGSSQWRTPRAPIRCARRPPFSGHQSPSVPRRRLQQLCRRLQQLSETLGSCQSLSDAPRVHKQVCQCL